MAQDVHVIRSTGSVGVWLAGAALAAAAMLDLAFVEPTALLHGLPPTLMALWVLGMILARPCVRFDDRQLVVVNPGVIHEIGWAAVEDLRRSAQVVVVASGRRVTAWGTPPPPRTKLIRRPLARQVLDPRGGPPAPPVRPDWAYQQLDGAWQLARSASGAVPETVRRRLDLLFLVPGLVLLAATVLSFTL